MGTHFGGREIRAATPTLFVEFRPSMRALLEDAIESLILLLDEMEGEADDEPNVDDEPDADDEHGDLDDDAVEGQIDQRLWSDGSDAYGATAMSRQEVLERIENSVA